MAKHVAGQLKEAVYAQFEQGEDLLEGIKAVVAERGSRPERSSR